jgi:hypothetical protein
MIGAIVITLNKNNVNYRCNSVNISKTPKLPITNKPLEKVVSFFSKDYKTMDNTKINAKLLAN